MAQKTIGLIPGLREKLTSLLQVDKKQRRFEIHEIRRDIEQFICDNYYVMSHGKTKAYKLKNNTQRFILLLENDFFNWFAQVNKGFKHNVVITNIIEAFADSQHDITLLDCKKACSYLLVLLNNNTTDPTDMYYIFRVTCQLITKMNIANNKIIKNETILPDYSQQITDLLEKTIKINKLNADNQQVDDPVQYNMEFYTKFIKRHNIKLTSGERYNGLLLVYCLLRYFPFMQLGPDIVWKLSYIFYYSVIMQFKRKSKGSEVGIKDKYIKKRQYSIPKSLMKTLLHGNNYLEIRCYDLLLTCENARALIDNTEYVEDISLFYINNYVLMTKSNGKKVMDPFVFQSQYISRYFYSPKTNPQPSFQKLLDMMSKDGIKTENIILHALTCFSICTHIYSGVERNTMDKYCDTCKKIMKLKYPFKPMNVSCKDHLDTTDKVNFVLYVKMLMYLISTENGDITKFIIHQMPYLFLRYYKLYPSNTFVQESSEYKYICQKLAHKSYKNDTDNTKSQKSLKENADDISAFDDYTVFSVFINTALKDIMAPQFEDFCNEVLLLDDRELFYTQSNKTQKGMNYLNTNYEAVEPGSPSSTKEVISSRKNIIFQFLKKCEGQKPRSVDLQSLKALFETLSIIHSQNKQIEQDNDFENSETEIINLNETESLLFIDIENELSILISVVLSLLLDTKYLNGFAEEYISGKVVNDEEKADLLLKLLYKILTTFDGIKQSVIIKISRVLILYLKNNIKQNIHMNTIYLYLNLIYIESRVSYLSASINRNILKNIEMTLFGQYVLYDEKWSAKTNPQLQDSYLTPRTSPKPYTNNTSDFYGKALTPIRNYSSQSDFYEKTGQRKGFTSEDDTKLNISGTASQHGMPGILTLPSSYGCEGLISGGFESAFYEVEQSSDSLEYNYVMGMVSEYGAVPQTPCNSAPGTEIAKYYLNDYLNSAIQLDKFLNFIAYFKIEPENKEIESRGGKYRNYLSYLLFMFIYPTSLKSLYSFDLPDIEKALIIISIVNDTSSFTPISSNNYKIKLNKILQYILNESQQVRLLILHIIFNDYVENMDKNNTNYPLLDVFNDISDSDSLDAFLLDGPDTQPTLATKRRERLCREYKSFYSQKLMTFFYFPPTFTSNKECKKCNKMNKTNYIMNKVILNNDSLVIIIIIIYILLNEVKSYGGYELAANLPNSKNYNINHSIHVSDKKTGSMRMIYQIVKYSDILNRPKQTQDKDEGEMNIFTFSKQIVATLVTYCNDSSLDYILYLFRILYVIKDHKPKRIFKNINFLIRLFIMTNKRFNQNKVTKINYYFYKILSFYNRNYSYLLDEVPLHDIAQNKLRCYLDRDLFYKLYKFSGKPYGNHILGILGPRFKKPNTCLSPDPVPYSALGTASTKKASNNSTITVDTKESQMYLTSKSHNELMAYHKMFSRENSVNPLLANIWTHYFFCNPGETERHEPKILMIHPSKLLFNPNLCSRRNAQVIRKILVLNAVIHSFSDIIVSMKKNLISHDYVYACNNITSVYNSCMNYVGDVEAIERNTESFELKDIIQRQLKDVNYLLLKLLLEVLRMEKKQSEGNNRSEYLKAINSVITHIIDSITPTSNKTLLKQLMSEVINFIEPYDLSIKGEVGIYGTKVHTNTYNSLFLSGKNINWKIVNSILAFFTKFYRNNILESPEANNDISGDFYICVLKLTKSLRVVYVDFDLLVKSLVQSIDEPYLYNGTLYIYEPQDLHYLPSKFKYGNYSYINLNHVNFYFFFLLDKIFLSSILKTTNNDYFGIISAFMEKLQALVIVCQVYLNNRNLKRREDNFLHGHTFLLLYIFLYKLVYNITKVFTSKYGSYMKQENKLYTLPVLELFHSILCLIFKLKAAFKELTDTATNKPLNDFLYELSDLIIFTIKKTANYVLENDPDGYLFVGYIYAILYSERIEALQHEDIAENIINSILEDNHAEREKAETRKTENKSRHCKMKVFKIIEFFLTEQSYLTSEEQLKDYIDTVITTGEDVSQQEDSQQKLNSNIEKSQKENTNLFIKQTEEHLILTLDVICDLFLKKQGSAIQSSFDASDISVALYRVFCNFIPTWDPENHQRINPFTTNMCMPYIMSYMYSLTLLFINLHIKDYARKVLKDEIKDLTDRDLILENPILFYIKRYNQHPGKIDQMPGKELILKTQQLTNIIILSLDKHNVGIDTPNVIIHHNLCASVFNYIFKSYFINNCSTIQEGNIWLFVEKISKNHIDKVISGIHEHNLSKNTRNYDIIYYLTYLLDDCAHEREIKKVLMYLFKTTARLKDKVNMIGIYSILDYMDYVKIDIKLLSGSNKDYGTKYNIKCECLLKMDQYEKALQLYDENMNALNDVIQQYKHDNNLLSSDYYTYSDFVKYYKKCIKGRFKCLHRLGEFDILNQETVRLLAENDEPDFTYTIVIRNDKIYYHLLVANLLIQDYSSFTKLMVIISDSNSKNEGNTTPSTKNNILLSLMNIINKILLLQYTFAQMEISKLHDYFKKISKQDETLKNESIQGQRGLLMLYLLETLESVIDTFAYEEKILKYINKRSINKDMCRRLVDKLSGNNMIDTNKLDRTILTNKRTFHVCEFLIIVKKLVKYKYMIKYDIFNNYLATMVVPGLTSVHSFKSINTLISYEPLDSENIKEYCNDINTWVLLSSVTSDNNLYNYSNACINRTMINEAKYEAGLSDFSTSTSSDGVAHDDNEIVDQQERDVILYIKVINEWKMTKTYEQVSLDEVVMNKRVTIFKDLCGLLSKVINNYLEASEKDEITAPYDIVASPLSRCVESYRKLLSRMLYKLYQWYEKINSQDSAVEASFNDVCSDSLTKFKEIEQDELLAMSQTYNSKYINMIKLVLTNIKMLDSLKECDEGSPGLYDSKINSTRLIDKLNVIVDEEIEYFASHTKTEIASVAQNDRTHEQSEESYSSSSSLQPSESIGNDDIFNIILNTQTKQNSQEAATNDLLIFYLKKSIEYNFDIINTNTKGGQSGTITATAAVYRILNIITNYSHKEGIAATLCSYITPNNVHMLVSVVPQLIGKLIYINIENNSCEDFNQIGIIVMYILALIACYHPVHILNQICELIINNNINILRIIKNAFNFELGLDFNTLDYLKYKDIYTTLFFRYFEKTRSVNKFRFDPHMKQHIKNDYKLGKYNRVVRTIEKVVEHKYNKYSNFYLVTLLNSILLFNGTFNQKFALLLLQNLYLNNKLISISNLIDEKWRKFCSNLLYYMTYSKESVMKISSLVTAFTKKYPISSVDPEMLKFVYNYILGNKNNTRYYTTEIYNFMGDSDFVLLVDTFIGLILELERLQDINFEFIQRNSSKSQFEPNLNVNRINSEFFDNYGASIGDIYRQCQPYILRIIKIYYKLKRANAKDSRLIYYRKKTNNLLLFIFISMCINKPSFVMMLTKLRADKKDFIRLEDIDQRLTEANVLNLHLYNKYSTQLYKIENKIGIIKSNLRPKNIVMIGSDGNKYAYLLKSNDNAKTEQMTMQIIEFLNQLIIMKNYARKGNYQPVFTYYNSLPLSDNCSFISWIVNIQTYNSTIIEYRKAQNVCSSEDNLRDLMNSIYLEKRIIREHVGNYDEATIPMKHFIYNQVEKTIPSNHLLRYIMINSASSIEFYYKKVMFSKSTGNASILSYVIGLGDRHPNNILLNNYTLELINIDYNDVFEVCRQRDTLPERVYCRLTRNIARVLNVGDISKATHDTSGIEEFLCKCRNLTAGLFRDTAIQLMNLTRIHRKTILMMVQEQLYINDILRSGKTASAPVEPHEAFDGTDILTSHNSESLKHSISKSTNTQLCCLTDKSMDIIGTFKAKLETGTSVEAQVDRVVAISMLPENICQAYSGWMPFW